MGELALVASSSDTCYASFGLLQTSCDGVAIFFLFFLISGRILSHQQVFKKKKKKKIHI